jgi:hypothetical protein
MILKQLKSIKLESVPTGARSPRGTICCCSAGASVFAQCSNFWTRCILSLSQAESVTVTVTVTHTHTHTHTHTCTHTHTHTHTRARARAHAQTHARALPRTHDLQLYAHNWIQHDSLIWWTMHRPPGQYSLFRSNEGADEVVFMNNNPMYQRDEDADGETNDSSTDVQPEFYSLPHLSAARIVRSADKSHTTARCTKPMTTRWLAASCVATALALAIIGIVLASSDARTSSLSAQVSTLTSQQADASSQVATLTSQLAASQRALNTLQGQIPLSCILTAWSSWSGCTTGFQFRTRMISRQVICARHPTLL